MIRHAPFSVFLTLLLVEAGVVLVTVASSRRVRGHLPRLGTSLGIGAVIAAALVAWVGKTRHAALAASAARPLPSGGHLSAAATLADGFVFTMLTAGVIVFVLLTLAARSSAARRRQAEQAERPGRGRARAGAWR